MMLLAVLLGAVSLSSGTTFTRPTSNLYPKSTSGITYAGGNTFYAVADDRGDLSDHEGGLYRYTINLSADGKTVSSATSTTTNQVVKLAGGYDQEGCAYDPATGFVWVSDEVRKSIKAFDPATGALKETLDYPSILTHAVGNYAVEGLTMTGDGLTMWFANEEGLSCDGGRSAYGKTTTVRLFKFTRENVRAPFRPAGQFPYTTDSWKCQHDYSSKARHGVAGLCALPDGSLLVLERDLSFSSTSGMAIAFGASYLGWSIYRVEAPEGATDVTEISSLTESASWTAVGKTLLRSEGSDIMSYGNFEGICLGPRLSNGDLSILLISDAGDGYSNPMIKPLVLSGLDICTLDFPAPSSGDAASIVGSNYRYLNGATVNVGLTGSGFASGPYTNRSDRLASWSLTTSGRKGTGPAASFMVSGDDTLVWTVAASGGTSPIVGHDTFEGQAAGTDSTAIAGWGENGTVVAATYPAPSVGTPMQKATHTQVLAVDDAILRDYDSQGGVRQQIDMMVRVVRPVEDAAVDATKYQGGVAVFADGRFRVFHADATGGTTSSVASDTVYSDGDWVRVTMAFDYTLAQPSFTLRLNGTYCGTYPCAGGKTRVAGLDISGDTALDDVIFTDGAPVFEVAADPSSTVPAGVTVSCAWLDRYGLAWNDTESDADKDGLKVWQEYLSGSSPLDGESVFKIADFKVDGSNVSIAFTGGLPRPDFLKVRWYKELGGEQTVATGLVTQEDGVSVWRAEVPEEARFFRAYLEK